MPTIYYMNGAGAPLLPYPALQFISEDDPVLGTSDPSVPEGPFNRELHKLLANTGALADVFQSYLSRTVTYANATNMPDPIVNPVSIANAPSTPGEGNYHTVYYQDYEALFRYNATVSPVGWYYVTSVLRGELNPGSGAILARETQTVQVDLTTLSGLQLTINIPTGFSYSHLKSTYIIATGDPEAVPVVSVMPMIFDGTTTLRLVLSIPPPLNSTYTLMCVFEKFTTL